MKSNLLNWLKIATALTLFRAVVSFDVNATPFELKSLRSTPITSVAEIVGLSTVTMIFQPDCSWCKKQSKTLTKAFEQCQSSLNINLVGTKGNARQLRKELKQYHQDIPAFIADRKFLRTIGGYQASPTTLIYDANGELVAKKRGFISEDKLAHALKLLTAGTCLI